MLTETKGSRKIIQFIPEEEPKVIFVCAPCNEFGLIPESLTNEEVPTCLRCGQPMHNLDDDLKQTKVVNFPGIK